MLDRILRIINSDVERDEKLRLICKALKRNIRYYNWVGFYISNNDMNELTLGPFEGGPTEHVNIPFGRGVCGSAAEKMKTVIREDVRERRIIPHVAQK